MAIPSIPDNAIEFCGVVKRHRAVPVLQGVDLSLVRGEFFGLAGVNGAGKTSLLKCLFDLCPLDGGVIRIFGLDHRSPAARAPLSFLPERFMPPWYLTGADFLRYLLTLQGIPYRQADVQRVLNGLDLELTALTRSARGYSKGMTQKLGLAACLLAAKPLLVLDEPMSGLDPKARALLKRQLQLLRPSGTTMLFTSHALADIDELCDRMAILHDGTIRFAGTPQQCRDSSGATNLEDAFMRIIA